MKNAFILCLLISLMSCQKKRDSYVITGNIEGITDSTVIDLYLMMNDIGKRVDVDTIINGNFKFSAALENKPARMSLKMRDMENYFGRCDLWVEEGNIEITGKGRYLSSWIVHSEVKEQKALNKLINETRDYRVMMDSLFLLRYIHRKDRKYSGQILNTIDSIARVQRKIEFEIIEDDPNSISSMKALYQIAKYDTSISKDRIKKVFGKLNPEYKNSLLAEGIASTFEERIIPKIGDDMVNFTAYDTAGIKYLLTDFKDKFILLDFWSYACGPCILANPETKELHSKYSELVTIVGVNMDTNEKQWKEALKKDSITWTNISDGKGTYSGISSDYGIRGFPTYILINPEGVIVDKWMGYWKGGLVQKLSNHIDGIKK
ncbi:MAG: AhpC/TSA family protein [Cytophagales bacterium]|nr:AhpC/TSA family protein [Cytophagales bacterium]